MQPNIIRKEKLFIAGISGDGSKTARLWEDFEQKYDNAAFDKADESGYEIRFDYDGKCDCHVGFAVNDKTITEGFTTLILPESEYAVFDVYVVNGYDSENKSMREWLSGNSEKYVQSEIDGKTFVVELYTERFKGGDKPDSIVEIWIPIHRA